MMNSRKCKSMIRVIVSAVLSGTLILSSACSSKRPAPAPNTSGETISEDTPWYECDVISCSRGRSDYELVEGQTMQRVLGKISGGYVYALGGQKDGGYSQALEVALYSESGRKTAGMDLMQAYGEAFPGIQMPYINIYSNLYIENDTVKCFLEDQTNRKIIICDLDIQAGSLSVAASFDTPAGWPYTGGSSFHAKCGEYDLFVRTGDTLRILSCDSEGNTYCFKSEDHIPDSRTWYVSDPIAVSGTEVIFMDFNTHIYYLYDIENRTISEDTEEYDWLKHYINPDRTDISRYPAEDGSLMFITEDAVASADFAGKTVEPIVLLENIDINRSFLRQQSGTYSVELLSVDETAVEFGITRLREDSDLGFEIYRATRSDTNPNAGKAIITTDGYYSDSIYDAIWYFNRTDNDYFIRIVPNIYRDTELSWTGDQPYLYTAGEIGSRMMVDLMSGDCPDVVFYVSGYGQLNNGNCMTDLMPYYEESGIASSVYDNIVRAYGRDGGLYAVPLAFTLRGVIVDRSRYDMAGPGMTFEQFGQFTDSYCNGLNIIARTQTDFLRECLYCSYDLYEHDGTMDFNCPEFREMAEYTSDHVNNMDQNDYFNRIFSERTVSSNTTIAGYLGWFSSLNDVSYDFGNADLIGYPSGDGRGPAAYINYSVSVTKGAASPEGAWRFIEMLLSTDVQRSMCGQLGTYQNMFPVNREAFDLVGEDCIGTYNHQLELQTAMMGEWAQDMPANQAEPEDLDTIRNIVGSVDHAVRSDTDVDIIVYEEIQAYLVGDKTLDEVIEIMNDRAQTVINERG